MGFILELMIYHILGARLSTSDGVPISEFFYISCGQLAIFRVLMAIDIHLHF
jgi:hypothetical protein